MNNDPNMQANSTAFSQQSGMSQSNPFTGDLKGEFTSDFGTNTNAVSQIFKGGSFTEDRKKAIFIGLGVLLVLGLAFAFFTSGEEGAEDEEMAGETTEEGAEGEEGAATADETGTPSETGTDAATAATDAAASGATDAATSTPAATGSFTLSSPQDGAQKAYDETQGPAVFEWQGAADKIVFARNPSMNPVNRTVTVTGETSYSFNHPHPGTWYWRVEGAGGQSEVRRFEVNPPERRSFAVSAPTSGGSIAGTGGVVQWSAGEKIARYQVQLKGPSESWANPQFRFGTSGTSVSLNGVPPGTYEMRVGAFSEVAGRWEWQNVSNVTVQ